MKDLIFDLQHALALAMSYSGYVNEKEKEALVFAIRKALQHATNQLI